MSGIEFDRQVFTTPMDTPRKPVPQAFGMVLLVLALGLAGFVGYKIFTQASQNSALASAKAQVDQLQQQLADSQKRLEDMEKHRRAVKVEPAAPAVAVPTAVKTAPARPVYRVVAASALPPQPKPAAPVPTVVSAPAPADNAKTEAMQSELTANHDAWQATTDRLADVVGVVGQQQNELSETRETVNQLLAQTRRQALSFELMRGTNRMPVGPVTLQLKSVDSKAQRYSVCVYVEDRCIELKDRVLNEVVVFVVSKGSAPLELVATKVLRDQIVGYLEVPTAKQ